jgi:hypothetical protein
VKARSHARNTCVPFSKCVPSTSFQRSRNFAWLIGWNAFVPEAVSVPWDTPSWWSTTENGV